MLNIAKKLEILLGSVKADQAMNMKFVDRVKFVENFIKDLINDSKAPLDIDFPNERQRDLAIGVESELLQINRPLIINVTVRSVDVEGTKFHVRLSVKLTEKYTSMVVEYPVLDLVNESVSPANIETVVVNMLTTVHAFIARVVTH